MKAIAIALLLVSLDSNAMADSSSQAQSAQPTDQVYLIFNPPLDAVWAKAKLYGHNVSTVVTVAYDNLGNVVSEKLDATSGDQRLDKAILAWAALAKVQAKGAGSGKLAVQIQINR